MLGVMNSGGYFLSVVGDGCVGMLFMAKVWVDEGKNDLPLAFRVGHFLAFSRFRTHGLRTGNFLASTGFVFVVSFQGGTFLAVKVACARVIQICAIPNSQVMAPTTMASSAKSSAKSTAKNVKAEEPKMETSSSCSTPIVPKYDAATYNGEKYRNIAKKLLKKDDVKKLYRDMLICRRFEERCAQMYQMRKIQGFCHLYIGQEAVAVGTIAALQPKDLIFQTYRDHAHALLKGISARECFAELFGKATGCSKGKGGSMHFFKAETGMMGGNGIVGGHVPMATGAAFASRYNDKKQVSVCYMGEAAVNQGVFHESLNMASLWKLPCVYITENNLYGMGTAVERASAEDQLYKRTKDAYRIPGMRCDGMDVLEMYGIMYEAAERARSGEGPTFLEAITYRYRGHSMSDPATTYRNKDEVSVWQRRDPMARLQADYPELLTEALINSMDEECKAEVQDAIKFAEESPFPDASELWTDIYLDYPGYPGPGQKG